MQYPVYKNRIFRLYLPLLLFLLAALSCEQEYKVIPPPTIYLNMPETGYELEVGDSITLYPKITYDYHSRYQWYLNGEVLGTTLTMAHKSLNLGEDLYSFVVNTPSGTDSAGIPVKTIILVDYDDYELPWNYSTGFEMDEPGFSTKGLSFTVIPASETAWTGFALSKKYSQSTTTQPDLFSAYAPAEKDNNFMIYHQSPAGHSIRFDDGANHLIGSLSVTNTTYTYLMIKYGSEDGSIKRFGGSNNDDPDWFLLTIEGYDNSGTYTGKVTFYLADYRFENNKRNYIVNTWNTIDLSALGAVNQINLKLSSSVTDANNEMLTPGFVCIDNLKVLN